MMWDFQNGVWGSCKCYIIEVVCVYRFVLEIEWFSRIPISEKFACIRVSGAVFHTSFSNAIYYKVN